MQRQNKQINNDLKIPDTRFSDIGLNDDERLIVLKVCNKFTNRRDEISDVIQEALLALHAAFKRRKERDMPPIRHMRGFVYRVTMNTLNYQFIQKKRGDAIYRANIYDSTTGLNPGGNTDEEEHTSAITELVRYAEEGDLTLLEVPEIRLFLEETIGDFTEKEIRILHYLADYNLTQHDVAVKFGMCQASVSNIVRKCLKRVEEALKRG